MWKLIKDTDDAVIMYWVSWIAILIGFIFDITSLLIFSVMFNIIFLIITESGEYSARLIKKELNKE